MEGEILTINSKEFWDFRYKKEIEEGYSRKDFER